MEIRTFGVGGRISECERILRDRLHGDGRLILLPIPTTKDNKYINGTSFTIDDISALLNSNSLVAGYNIPSQILSSAKVAGARVYDAGLDEEFLTENAELTARGTIGYILTQTDKDVRDMRIGVVGYGRIGISLIRWLLLFGAEVVLYTNRESVALEVGEMGLSSYLIGKDVDFSGLDILINTAPARQISPSDLSDKTTIIDLASGKIFDDIPRLVKLSSIPDAFYPISAGRLYADAITLGLWGDKI